jgi:hypothetical protein
MALYIRTYFLMLIFLSVVLRVALCVASLVHLHERFRYISLLKTYSVIHGLNSLAYYSLCNPRSKQSGILLTL